MRPHIRKRILAVDLILVALFFVFSARLARAEIFVISKDAPLADVARLAGEIVQGSVESTESYWKDGQIYTKATLKVVNTIKGPRADEVVFVFRGGAVGDISMQVSGHPDFANRQPSILFLTKVGSELRPYGGAFARIDIHSSINGDVVSLPEDGQMRTVDLKTAIANLRRLGVATPTGVQ